MTQEALRSWSHFLLWTSIVLPLLGGVAAAARYYIERGERRIATAALERQLTTFRARTERRAFQPTPETVAALSTDPRGPLLVIVDSSESETMEYADQWVRLLQQAGWNPSSSRGPNPQIPPGVTLVVDKAQGAAAHALHLHSVLATSGLPIVVQPVGATAPGGFSDPGGELLLLIGRRP